MKRSFQKRTWYITLATLVIGGLIIMMFGVNNHPDTELVTTIVETGPVRQLVSVSGITEAKRSADLAFPVTGIIREVKVAVGTTVETGDVLAVLDTRALHADRQEALAALTKAIADRDELLKGPTGSAREVTTETVASKEAALASTKINEAQKIDNAYRTLLTTDLIPYSTDVNEDAPPPEISGTYTCDSEGTYSIEVFRSASDSGYSFRLSGLETGTYTVSTKQPSPLGICGLQIQFDADARYTNSEWLIDIPNQRSTSYTSNHNAYELAINQAESAITQAEKALSLAQADAADQNAPARLEAVTRANAAVTQAQARVERLNSMIADHTLVAPFAGTITKVDILPGETVTTAPMITLLGGGAFTVTARIPEIDISKLQIDQTCEMLFDARSNEILSGHITFISPEATEIDGVAYFEATIVFNEIPSWMRAGLNTDIDIIITETTVGLRIPKRFLVKTETGYEVLLKRGESIATTTVDLVLEGNDGFVAITGLTTGDTLIAP